MAKTPPQDDAPGPFNNPFGSLKGQLGTLPEGKAPAASPVKAAPKGPQKAVVRYERKGHGGKEVTRVEQLGLRERDLEVWLKEAKAALGSGGHVDGDTLVIQGDQRERLRSWLTKKNVQKIVVS